mgnify:CR=1 FL=1
METPITELQWLVLTDSPGKGIKDGHGIVWKVLRPCGSVARPNALRLKRIDEECEAFWYQNEVWSDLENPGQFIRETDFSYLNVEIVDVP